MTPDIHEQLRKGGNSRRMALLQLGEWVKYTCLLADCKPETAYEVAAIFVGGLRRELDCEPREYPFSVR